MTTVHTSRTNTGYLIEWEGLARMHVGETLDFRPCVGVTARAIDKLRRGPAAAAERYLRGTGLGFHASAIAWRGRGMLIAGESGVGKSTTASLLIQEGGGLLADDIALIAHEENGFMIEPTEPEILLDDVACAITKVCGTPFGSKFAVRTATTIVTRFVLFIELVMGSDWRVDRLHGANAMKSIAKARACPDIDEPARMLDDFRVLARIHEQVATYRLTRPKDPRQQRIVEILSSLLEPA